MKKKIIKILVILMTLTIAWENFAFASQSKWDAYPEWGIMVKISYFSTSMVILFLGLQVFLYFIKNKLNKNILNKVYKKIFYISNLMILSMILSIILVVLDVYSYALIIYVILMIIGAILDWIVTKKIADNTSVRPFLIVALILTFVFVMYSYEHSYPFEGNDPGDMMEIPANITIIQNLR